MFRSEELRKARAILETRLAGLHAVGLFDLSVPAKIPCDLDIGNLRIEGFAEMLPVLLHAARAACAGTLGEVRQVALQYAPPESNTLLAAQIHETLWVFVIADDKIGDVLFHTVWSESESLGAMPHLRNAAAEYATRDARLGAVPLQKQPLDREGAPAHLARELAPAELARANDLLNYLPKASFIAFLRTSLNRAVIPSIALSPAAAADRPSDTALLFVLDAALGLIHRDNYLGGSLKTILVVSDQGHLLADTRRDGAWLVVGERAEIRELGRSFYWIVERGEPSLHQTLGPTPEKNAISSLSGATAKLQGVFALMLGNWREKLPYCRPLRFSNPEEIGEFLGLTDITASLIELGDEFHEVVSADLPNSSVDFVLLECQSGCSAVGVIDSHLCFVLAAREKTEAVLKATLQATTALRQLFPPARRLPAQTFSLPEEGSVRDTSLWRLKPASTRLVAQVCGRADGLLLAATHRSRSLEGIHQRSASLGHVPLFASTRLSSCIPQLLHQVERILEKSVVFNRFALGDVLGRLNAVTYSFRSGVALSYRKGGIAATHEDEDEVGCVLAVTSTGFRRGWEITDAIERAATAQETEHALERGGEQTVPITSVAFFDERGQLLRFDQRNEVTFSDAVRLSALDLRFEKPLRGRDTREEIVYEVVQTSPSGTEEVIYAIDLRPAGSLDRRLSLPQLPALRFSCRVHVRLTTRDGNLLGASSSYCFEKRASRSQRLGNALGGWKFVLGNLVAIPFAILAGQKLKDFPVVQQFPGMDEVVKWGAALVPLLLFAGYRAVKRRVSPSSSSE